MKNELRERLINAELKGRPLRVYCGYDPNSRLTYWSHGHHAKITPIPELGHQVIFLIGTYTALIGDPSDKDKLRPQLTQEEFRQNAETYAEQAFRILDREN